MISSHSAFPMVTKSGAGSSAVSSGEGSDDQSQTASGIAMRVEELRRLGRSRKVVCERLCLAAFNVATLVLAVWFLIEMTLFMKGVPMVAEKSFTVDLGAGRVYAENASVGILIFTSASDAGQVAILSQNGGRGFYFDSGMGHYNGVVTSNGTIIVVGSHKCSNEAGDSGILATHCSNGICAEGCLLPNGIGSASVASLHSTFVLEEFYRTKNSIGFGVTYTDQHVSGMRLSTKDSNTLIVDTVLHAVSKSNANKDLLYWQEVFIILQTTIVANVATRILAAPIFFRGIKLKGATLRIRADLVGGLFTSPGVMMNFFVFTVVVRMHLFLWLEASGYKHTLLSNAQIATAVCAFVALLVHLGLKGANLRLRCSGSVLFLLSLAARMYTIEGSRAKAKAQIRGLGQVLERDCEVFEVVSSAKVNAATTTCNVADGVGLSGLEIFFKLYSETLLVTLGLLLLFEILMHILGNCCTGDRNAKYRLGSSRDSTVTPSSKIGRLVKRARKKTKISNYQRVMLLSGRGTSVFARSWAGPLRTPWSVNYYHVSSFVEDNVILWGPLLISLTLYPIVLLCASCYGKRKTVRLLIATQLYIGVLVNDQKLESVLVNRDLYSEYVENYDYDNMEILNGEPVR